MNFKKFISGVSALTIAASAFASMAVTASAADKEATLLHTASQIAGSTKRYWTYRLDQDPFYTGINTGAGKSYAGYGYVQFQLPEIAANEVFTSATLSLGLDYNKPSGTRGIELHEVSGFAVADGAEAGEWAYDGTPENYNDVPFGSWDSGVDHRTAITIGDTIATESWARESLQSVKTWTPDVTDSVAAVYAAESDIVSFALTGINAGPSIAADSISLTVTTVPKGAATDIDVSYKANGVEVASSIIDISGQELSSGDDYTFYVPAYVEANNTIYAVSGSYEQKPTLAEGTTNVDVPVTAVSATVYAYAEFDGSDPHHYSSKSQFSNGTLKTGLGYGKTIGSVEAPEDGVYTVTIHTGANDSATSDKTGSIVIAGETSEETVSFARSNGGSIKVIENVTLKEGDTVAVTAAEGKSGLDYILLQKTGDIPTPVETTEAGFTFKSTIEKLADQDVTLTITASNGVETKEGSVDITEKLAGFDGELMLAVILSDIPEGITIESATISVE